MTAVEKQALEILVIFRREFKNKGYFTDNDILELQLGTFFNNTRSWKDKALDKIYHGEFNSVWQVISFLNERGYIKREAVGGYQITNSGKVKIGELESLNYSFSKIIKTIGTIGGIIYVINELITLLKRI